MYQVGCVNFGGYKHRKAMVEESCVRDLLQSQAFWVRVRPLCDGMCVRWVTILLSMGIHVVFSTQLEAFQHELWRVPLP